MSEIKESSTRTRKNYRWHWTTMRQIEELKTLVPHCDETDLLSRVIQDYLRIIKEQKSN